MLKDKTLLITVGIGDFGNAVWEPFLDIFLR